MASPIETLKALLKETNTRKGGPGGHGRANADSNAHKRAGIGTKASDNKIVVNVDTPEKERPTVLVNEIAPAPAYDTHIVENIDLSAMAGMDLDALRVALKPRLNKYIPYTPTAKQTAFLAMNGLKEILYGGDVCLDTPLLTTKGWKTMGTVLVGDYVFTENGEPTEVTWKSEVMHNPCYRMTFDNGVEEVIAGEGHKWEVHRRRQDRKERVVEIQYTKELYERFSRNAPKNRGSLYAIPVTALQRSVKEQPVDAYVLGAWLGDGHIHTGYMSTVEEEVMDEFRAAGYDVYFTPSSTQYDRPDIHGEEGRMHHWCSERLRTELRAMGILDHKCIPEEYMNGSYDQRLALLQGIMDTDGCATNRPGGDVELTLANKELAYQCEELIKSLGMRVTCKESTEYRDDPRYPKGEYTRYRMHWTNAIKMFRLPRKFDRQCKETPSVQKYHFVSHIEPVDTVPTQCIEVANQTHLYLLTRSLIRTHNSAGGGKSVSQLMAALQFVDIPGYSAILFRKTYADLSLPGALISMAKEWLMPFVATHEVHWSDKDKKFTFPSGATLAFGYLESLNDCFRYQGAEFQYIGFDECTHIAPANYRYMFSRLRKAITLKVPLRFRATCNPGGEFGQYYHNRFFIEGKANNRIFIAAGLADNPYLDADQYREALSELDPITRAQLLDGNWDIKESGNMFIRTWYTQVPAHDVPSVVKRVRFWDVASTDPSKRKGKDKRDPDWTVGFKLASTQGMYWIEDICRFQKKPAEVEEIIKQTAMLDGYNCHIRMEQEPGSSGDISIDHYARKVLDGYSFAGVRSTGSKVQRAEFASSASQQGRVLLSSSCRNIPAFFDEIEAFPFGAKDDIVDAFSGAMLFFRKTIISSAPTTLSKGAGSYWNTI